MYDILNTLNKFSGKSNQETATEKRALVENVNSKSDFGQLLTKLETEYKNLSESSVVNEKAESEAQATAARIALAAKRGEIPKSELEGASKEMYSMSEKDLEDFTKTKKGAPEKVSEEWYEADQDNDSVPTWDENDLDYEGGMAMNQLNQIEDAARELEELLDAEENLPEWVQQKIILAKDYIDTARDYMKGAEETERDEAVRDSVDTMNESITDPTLAHIIKRFPAEVKAYKQGADLSDDLYHALYDYYLDSGDMPYGVAKARDGDPSEWVSKQFYYDLGLGGGSMIAPMQEENDLEGELSDLAQLAGLGEALDPVDEKEAKKDFKDRADKDINNDGKIDTTDEYLHSKRQAIAKASENEKVDEDVNVNISATEEDAVNMIKQLAGLESSISEPEFVQPEVMDVEMYGDELEEEREIEHANTPREKQAPIAAATPGGNDYHKSKKAYPAAEKGDNPMTVAEDQMWQTYETIINGYKK